MKIGVLLLNLGAPDSLEAVRPFLYNLFSDRDIIHFPVSQKAFASLLSRMRARKVKKRYDAMGGKSPLLDITLEQAAALEKDLKGHGDFKVYVGMRYWHPFIGEAVRQMSRDGIKKVVVLPLYPQYSKATTGSCLAEFKREVERQNESFDTYIVDDWATNPFYLDALADTVKEGLRGFDEPHVLFSAHGLPVKFIEGGDPYADQLEATIEGVTEKVTGINWHASFQGKVGPMEWLGPETKDVIVQLAGEGCRHLLMVPVSFVSDHVETLYEMDIMYRKQAEGLGVEFRRAPSLNTRPAFIKALAQIVKDLIQ